MNNLHPHLKEEVELQEFYAAGLGHADREEVRMGARWNNNWQDEFILSDRDVWYNNPCYHGPASPRHPEDDHEVSPEEEAAYAKAYAAYFENESLWDAVMEEVS